MSTKYIKVEVSERKPNEDKSVFSDLGWALYYNGDFINNAGKNVYPQFWFEEIVDKSESLCRENYDLKETLKGLVSTITVRMTELNIGKAELSQSVGIGRTSLWRYLKGEKEMTLGTLIKICEKLDLKMLVVIK